GRSVGVFSLRSVSDGKAIRTLRSFPDPQVRHGPWRSVSPSTLHDSRPSEIDGVAKTRKTAQNRGFCREKTPRPEGRCGFRNTPAHRQKRPWPRKVGRVDRNSARPRAVVGRVCWTTIGLAPNLDTGEFASLVRPRGRLQQEKFNRGQRL